MADNEKKVQIYPAKIRIVPNCKLVKITGNQTETNYQKLLSGKNRGVVEKKKTKKRGELVSKYYISNVEGYDNTDPLKFFDYSVLSVCISEIEEGNTCTTPAIILRGLTGKVGKADEGIKLYPEQRAAILNSVEKLMSTVITVDNSAVNKALGYNDGKEEIVTDTILPCRFITEKINGQIVDDTIYFDRQSPLFKIADQRNQVIRYDAELLDVPNQNNTPLVITIKNYVILRVMECKLHKMTPTLRLDDIFKKARIEGATRKAKLDARICIDKFFNHLQNKGVIKSFEWTKKGNKFFSVKFTF